MLKKLIADRLDARYGRRSIVQRLDKRFAELDRRLMRLEGSAVSQPSLDADDDAAFADLKGEVALLRHQVAELTRLLDKR